MRRGYTGVSSSSKQPQCRVAAGAAAAVLLQCKQRGDRSMSGGVPNKQGLTPGELYQPVWSLRWRFTQEVPSV